MIWVTWAESAIWVTNDVQQRNILIKTCQFMKRVIKANIYSNSSCNDISQQSNYKNVRIQARIFGSVDVSIVQSYEQGKNWERSRKLVHGHTIHMNDTIHAHVQ